MVCPKCEIGEIITTITHIDGEIARFCEYCQTIWYKDEVISATTGHNFSGHAAETRSEKSTTTEEKGDA